MIVESVQWFTTILAALSGAISVHDGYLSQYAPNLMEATVEARQSWNQLPNDVSNYDGFIAVVDCDLVGNDALLIYADGSIESMLISDCSGHVSTTRWMRDNAIIGEVGYETAERKGFVGRGGVSAMLIILD